MLVREYRPEDYAQIKKWCEDRGLPPIPEHALPATGFIVDGTAAAFLYKTDSSFAVIDCMISSLDVSLNRRDAALDDIMSALINKAKQLGFKGIKAETKRASVKARAMSHGFYDCGPHSCLYLEL